jgi:hypothetical protein
MSVIGEDVIEMNANPLHKKKEKKISKRGSQIELELQRRQSALAFQINKYSTKESQNNSGEEIRIGGDDDEEEVDKSESLASQFGATLKNAARLHAEIKNKKREEMNFWEEILPYGFWIRLTDSNSGTLPKFIKGEDLDILTIDNFVNTFVVSNALVLTIPYTVVSEFSTIFWDNYQDYTSNCVELFSSSYSAIRLDVTTVIYCSTICLVMSIFYYLLRPHTPIKQDEQLIRIHDQIELLNLKFSFKDNLNDEDFRVSIMDKLSDVSIQRENFIRKHDVNESNKFKKWWKRGRLIIFGMFLTTSISIVCLLHLSTTIFNVHSITSDEICERPANNSLRLGFIVTLIIFLCSIYILV